MIRQWCAYGPLILVVDVRDEMGEECEVGVASSAEEAQRIVDRHNRTEEEGAKFER